MKPWLAHYDSDVRPSLAPYPDKTLARLPDAARARPRRQAGAAVQGRARSPTASSTPRATRSPRRSSAVGVRKGDRVALRPAQLPAVLRRRVRRVEGRRASSSPLNPTYSERELEQALDATRAEIVVALTPFYDRVKQVQGRTGSGASSRRRSRSTCRRRCACSSRCSRRRRTATASRCRRATSWLQDLLRQHRGAPRPAVAVRPGRSRGDPVERRHDRHAEGRRRAAPPLRRRRPAAVRVDEVGEEAVDRRHHAAAAAVPRLRATSACSRWRSSGPNPLSLVPNPRDIDDLLKTIKQVKPAFFNGVPTLYTAILNHPDVRAGKVDLQLDQAVLLRRRGADGRNEAAVRGADRRAHRRRATR